MNCPQCGNAITAENAKFCPSCGAPVAAATAPTQAQRYAIEIQQGPAFSIAVVSLQPEQSIRVEAGAMVSMSANVELNSEMTGGLMGALKRAVTRESLFQSIFTARGGPGELVLAPGSPGDIVLLELRDQAYLVQSASYLAGDPGLAMDTQFGGVKSFFAGEGLFLIKMSGSGMLLLASFGAIYKRSLAPGQRYVVDTGHLVAFEAQMQYQVRKASQQGWIKSFTSGEGVVAEFQGPGDLYIQTRNLSSFATDLLPFLPLQGKSGGFSFSVGG
ncbi:MAG TPA: TIGR00266 family protein [Candidatus Nitrosotenuis sp.]|jgi:uncharacterized protein (TIGR00266 family)|nr:TIGR00266 family protein [Candidatus Nitrosotenuis sp.]